MAVLAEMLVQLINTPKVALKVHLGFRIDSVELARGA